MVTKKYNKIFGRKLFSGDLRTHEGYNEYQRQYMAEYRKLVGDR